MCQIPWNWIQMVVNHYTTMQVLGTKPDSIKECPVLLTEEPCLQPLTTLHSFENIYYCLTFEIKKKLINAFFFFYDFTPSSLKRRLQSFNTALFSQARGA